MELYKSVPHCEFPSSKILVYIALSLHTLPETNLSVSICESVLIEMGNRKGSRVDGQAGVETSGQ